MSEFHVEVVRVGPIEKHPNADTLGITKIRDYPVIVRLGDYHEGDLAVYVPVDSVVPSDDPRWAFLDGHWHVKAKRLRGIFSMGLLTPLPPADPPHLLGSDMCTVLRITKYVPPEEMKTGGEDESDPGFMPCYTDIEGLRRYPDILVPGEEVAISEKVHGANGRWVFQNDRLWCASHHNWKKQNPDVIWWKAAAKNGLDVILAKRQDLGFYGEVFGNVQDLKYGAKPGDLFVRFFDVMDLKSKRYLDYDDFAEVCKQLGLVTVPLLYRGPWDNSLRALAEGKTTIPGADHVREGIVIRPVKERWNDQIGRTVLKLHGEMYLTRKGK